MALAISAKAQPSAGQGPVDLLLIVRGIAALSVVFWHAGGYLEPYPAWMNIPGRTAVWIFFGISGYVIAHGFVHGRYGLNGKDLQDFYVNRLLRIYPVFLALTLVGWMTETLRTGTSPLSMAELPSQLLAFQFNQDYALNGVFWTLGIELHFYLLAPLLMLPLLSKHPARWLWGPVVLYAAFVGWGVLASKTLGWSFDGRNIVACLPHFIAGMTACRAVAHTRPNRSRLIGSLVAAITLLVVTNLFYHRFPHRYWGPTGIILTDAVVVCLVVAHASWAGQKTVTVGMLTKLGVLSYGLYAWHGYWLKTMPEMVHHALALAGLSLASAYLTYKWVERPALRLKRVHVAKGPRSPRLSQEIRDAVADHR